MITIKNTISVPIASLVAVLVFNIGRYIDHVLILKSSADCIKRGEGMVPCGLFFPEYTVYSGIFALGLVFFTTLFFRPKKLFLLIEVLGNMILLIFFSSTINLNFSGLQLYLAFFSLPFIYLFLYQFIYNPIYLFLYKKI